MDHEVRVEGAFSAACFDGQGELLWREDLANDVVDLALTDLLSVYFAAGTPKTAWAVGLIDGAGSPLLASSDSMSSHSGWLENTSYSQSTRGAWSPTVSAGLAANAAGIPYTFTAAGLIAGLFVTSSSTKGGSTGTLWSTALFAVTRAVAVGQTLRLTYTLRAVGGAG